jgi:regulator of sigma E protease
LRGGKTTELRPTLGTVAVNGTTIGFLGARASDRLVVPLGLDRAAIEPEAKTWAAMTDTVHGVIQAIANGRGTRNFAGVLGIAQIAGQADVAGDTSIFTLIAIRSANEAPMSLLPIPVLDGGALLFLAAEWIRNHLASMKLQDFATRTNVAAMAALFMLSMIHDLPDLLKMTCYQSKALRQRQQNPLI